MSEPATLPTPIGSRHHNTRRRPRGARYGFFMDHKGRAWLDKPPDTLDAQWLMTITRKTDPDDIAAEDMGGVT